MTAADGDGRTAHVTLSGDLDFLHKESVLAAAHAALATRPETLVLSLAGSGVLDSSGIAALVEIHTTARHDGIHVQITDVPERTRQLLDRAGLVAVFDLR